MRERLETSGTPRACPEHLEPDLHPRVERARRAPRHVGRREQRDAARACSSRSQASPLAARGPTRAVSRWRPRPVLNSSRRASNSRRTGARGRRAGRSGTCPSDHASQPRSSATSSPRATAMVTLRGALEVAQLAVADERGAGAVDEVGERRVVAHERVVLDPARPSRGATRAARRCRPRGGRTPR